MMRRTFSRLLAGLCIVYLLLVFAFHRQLLPNIDDAVSDDYDDNSRHSPHVVIHKHVTSRMVVNESVGVQPGGVVLNDAEHMPGEPNSRHVKFNQQLQQLEQGMTQLEQQIADVKAKLTNEVLARAARKQQQEQQQKQQQQQQQQQQRQGDESDDEDDKIEEDGNNIEDDDVDFQYNWEQDGTQEEKGDEELLEEVEQQKQERLFELRREQREHLLQLRRREHQRRLERMRRRGPQPEDRRHYDYYRNGVLYNDLNGYYADYGHGRPIDFRRSRRPPHPFDRDIPPRRQPGVAVMDRGGREHLPRMGGGGGAGPLGGPDGNGRERKIAAAARQPSFAEMFRNSSLVGFGQTSAAVYSAYYDDRIVNKPYVRLMMITTGHKEERRLQCHFDSPSHAVSATVEAVQYEMCENHNRKYKGFIYSCLVPQGASSPWAPVGSLNVSLSSLGGHLVPIPVPVQPVTPFLDSGIKKGRQVVLDDSRYHQYKYNYSVCVSPLFGSVSGRRLVEWLEMTRLLGVQQVFFYDYEASQTVRKILNFYQDKGWVTVFPWKLPATLTDKTIWYHGQLVTNNDCLYRTMAVSAFTAFHDIDEFIVPHAPGIRTWGELLPPVLPNDTCGFSFHSAFFNPINLVGDPPEGDELLTVSRVTRTAMLSKVRTKVIVAPRRVFEVGIHHVSKQFQEHWQSRPFNSSLAILHHYRGCIRDYGMKCTDWFNDATIPDKFLPQLKDNFLRVVKSLGL